MFAGGKPVRDALVTLQWLLLVACMGAYGMQRRQHETHHILYVVVLLS